MRARPLRARPSSRDEGDLPALGVIGTVVLDRIQPFIGEGRAPSRPVRSMGGITYALHALAALGPHPSAVVPILHLGADASSFVRAELAGLGVDTRFLLSTSARQNAVELRYTSPEQRHEVLSGGVPPLRPADLGGFLREVDALYVNFVAGNELTLAGMRSVRRGFAGAIYADLHSLLLGRTRAGLRLPRPLRAWREWVACFDIVQCNAQEAALLRRGSRSAGPRSGTRGAGSRRGGSPRPLAEARAESLAREVLRLGPRLFIVTSGAGPVRAWPARGRSWRVTPPPGKRVRDPTGCGDVLGGAFCALHLLRGLPAGEALARAVRAASLNATRSGTDGLTDELRGWAEHGHG
ncbi:MAG: carbohydrate kinase family protein [Gemmatimonadota bacterium]